MTSDEFLKLWKEQDQEPEGCTLVEEGEWEQDYKDQIKLDVWRVDATGQLFSVQQNRQGSPFTDWYYGDRYCHEVFMVEEVKKVVSYTWKRPEPGIEQHLVPETPVAQAATGGHQDRAHARLSASGSYRWLFCTMSPFLEEVFPNTTSVHAAAGTWLHEYSETQIRQALGLISHQDYVAARAALDESEHNTSEQREKAQVYIDFVLAKIREERSIHGADQVVVLIEQRVEFTNWVPFGFGTADCIIITPHRIIVIDLKGGQGVYVDAEDNAQLRIYGLGSVQMYGPIYDFAEVEMIIVQPYRENISTELMGREELEAWAESVVVPAAQKATTGEGAAFAVGDHCHFCRARPRCRARAEAAQAGILPNLDMPELMTDHELIRVFPRAHLIKAWASDVEKLVKAIVLNGRAIEGTKRVRAKTKRVINDERTAVSLLAMEGYPEAVVTEPPPAERPLLGLGKLEKLVGKKKLAGILGSVIEKPEGEIDVVPLDDPRASIDEPVPTADEDFS